MSGMDSLENGKLKEIDYNTQPNQNHQTENLNNGQDEVEKALSTFASTSTPVQPFAMPLVPLQQMKDWCSNSSVVFTGTACGGVTGPAVGTVDIGVSKSAYYFCVALPGVKKDPGEFSCEVHQDGKVCIRGVTTTGGKTVLKYSRVFEMKFQQQSAPGPFMLFFSLPGPVDPRLFSPTFRSDAIFEGVVAKYNFVISSILYAGVAICGYLMFAEATDPQFTLNLPTKMVASKVARWTVVVAPVTKFSLTITPIALSIEELLPSNQRESYGVSILVRTILVISTLVMALAIPYFGSMMAFIGSFLVMLISLILPCVCYMRTGGGSLTKSQIGVCNFIIIVGVLSAITGTYSALKSMSG